MLIVAPIIVAIVIVSLRLTDIAAGPGPSGRGLGECRDGDEGGQSQSGDQRLHDKVCLLPVVVGRVVHQR